MAKCCANESASAPTGHGLRHGGKASRDSYAAAHGTAEGRERGRARSEQGSSGRRAFSERALSALSISMTTSTDSERVEAVTLPSAQSHARGERAHEAHDECGIMHAGKGLAVIMWVLGP